MVESDIQARLNMPGAKQNQQKREQSGNVKAELVFADPLNRMWVAATKDRQKSEIAISYHVASKQLMWGSKDMMREQASLWRDLRRQGKIEILEGNCVARKDKRGKMWNLLVVQPTNLEEAQMDRIALLEFGFAVSGFVYFFKTAENRDIIYNFVMEK